MEFWRLIFCLFFVGGLAQAAVPGLEKGRSLLQKGSTKEAQAAYQQVDFAATVWPVVVEDYIRYHLNALAPTNRVTSENANQAWRLSELLIRVQKPIDHLQYYRALSAYLGGSCPLALDFPESIEFSLLKAAAYRSSQRFAEGPGFSFNDSFNRAKDSEHVVSLAGGLNPHFKDLARARLIPGSGCRLARLNMRSETSAAEEELKSIIKALEQNSPGSTFSLTERDLAFLRLYALKLADRLDNKEVEEQLTKTIQELSWEQVFSFPDTERRYLFKIKGGDKNLIASKSAFYPLVKKVLLSANKDEAEWIAALDLKTLSVKDRKEIFTYLKSVEKIRHPYFVTYQLALALYENGEHLKALKEIRELLLETGHPLEKPALDLVVNITREYKFDDQIMGALHAAVPARLWNQLQSELILQYAVRGDRVSFRKVAHRVRAQSPLVRSFLSALAERDLGRFRKILKDGLEGRTISQNSLDLFSQIAATYFDLTEKQLRSLTPFSVAIATELKGKLAVDSNSDFIQDLIHVFGQSDRSGWLEGNRAIRSGSLLLGRVDLREAAEVLNPFVLQMPSALPKRDLIFVPKGLVSRAWELK